MCQEVYAQHLSLLVLPLPLIRRRQIVKRLRDVWIVRPEFLLVDVERPFVVLFNLLVLALVLTQQRKVVQLLRYIRVLVPKYLEITDERQMGTYCECGATTQRCTHLAGCRVMKRLGVWTAIGFKVMQYTDTLACWHTFSRITSARRHIGSASLNFPRFPYSTARLFSVAATAG